ncbi:MAG: EthD family reductase [Chthoniobacteraceae bacterium]
MIRTFMLYPNVEGVRFDHGYYLNKHLPMVKSCFGLALKGLNVDKGIVGGAPGTPPPYIIAAQMTFESIEVFQEAFAPHAQTILSDIPNFTDLQPIMMIGEIIHC